MESIRVTCLLDRSGMSRPRVYRHAESRPLLDTASEEEDGQTRFRPGIVLLDDGAFASVPLEFIRKEPQPIKKGMS